MDGTDEKNSEDRMQQNMEGAPVLDKVGALERIGGDEELLGEIASLFLEEYPGLLKDAREALDAGNSAGLERAAHSLKGSVSNFGAARTVEAAFSLERQARAGDLSSGAEGLARLETQLNLLRTELQKLAGNS